MTRIKRNAKEIHLYRDNFRFDLDSIDCIDLSYDQNYMVYLTSRNTQHYIDNPRHEFAGILVQHYNTELTRN